MKSRPWRCAAVAVTLAATATVAGCTGGDGNGSEFTYSSATKVGTVIPVGQRKKAEDVSLSLLAGGMTTLGAYRGKVVVVNFWATWCPPCVVETPQFDLMYRKVRTHDVQVLGINTKDQRGKAAQFVQDNHISFPIAFDGDGRAMLGLGNIPSAALPVTAVLDRQGRVAAVYVGRLATLQVEPVVLKLAAESR